MIIFQSVTKRFGDDVPPAVENVSFEIGSGELVVITGHSGSGKTTLMRLLTKEYLPTEGEIVFEDTPLSEIKPGQVHHHRRRIGVIFQDYKLLPELNIWENIALPLYITGKPEPEIEARVTDLLRLVDIEEKAFLFPSQLSGGEAQRVSIARALATGPGVIFADEPTGNLDQDTTVTIAKLLQKINELGTTLLLTTHDLGVLEMLEGERVLTLEKGRLVKDSHRKQSGESVKKESSRKESSIKDEEPKREATPEKKSPSKNSKNGHKTKEAPEKSAKVAPAAVEPPDEPPQTKPARGPRLKISLPKLNWGKKKSASEPDTKNETKTKAEAEDDVETPDNTDQADKNNQADNVDVKVEKL